MDGIGHGSGMAGRGIALGGLAAMAVALALAGSSVLATGVTDVTAGGATLATTDAPAGLVVTSLQTDGPSAAAGLRVGDVIDRVDGVQAPTADMLVRAEADPVARLHVAARGDAGARTLVLRRSMEGQGEDPDRRGR